MLDDSAYFAANSIELNSFVLTVEFTTYLTRPISSGYMKSIGKVVSKTKTNIMAESVVYDSREREIGRGTGIFVISKHLLANTKGYGI